MRKQLITVVRNTFGLAKNDALDKIEPAKIKSVTGLPSLLTLLADPTATQHDLATALEVVVVNTKMQRSPSAFGTHFLKQVDSLIDAPNYTDRPNKNLNPDFNEESNLDDISTPIRSPRQS